MKLIKTLSIGVIAVSALSYACGGGGSSSNNETTTEATPRETTAPLTLEEKYKDDPIFVAGSAKAKEAGCTACHMVERKIVGPAYADVAAKYENTEENVKMLTSHVINGHVGTWGEIQMPAHPHLNEGDVESMIKYVLLLRK